jgi:DNA adenine methylase
MNKSSQHSIPSADIQCHRRANNPATASLSAAEGPFLKWVGGKRRLLPQLLPLLPSGKRLIEPFVGAGSIFMATDYPNYLLADTNATLINLYRLLQEQPGSVISRACSHFVEENCNQSAYNVLRSRFNATSTTEDERAALFIYLNKFAFNGLYRVNKRGEMNAPFAHHTTVPRFPSSALKSFAHKLERATVLCSDFEETMQQAEADDVVYCDPPYLELENGRDTFTSYAHNGFAFAEHEKLASRARDLAAKGIPVVISNHDSPLTRSLYAGAALHTLSAYRSISGKPGARGSAAELVAVFNG